MLWAAVGTSAAISLGIREDFGLPVAAALALVAQFTSRDNLYPRSRAQGTEDSTWHRQ